MAIPHVAFSADSTSAIDCALWIGQNVVQGELIEQARADLPGALRIGYRLSDSILEGMRPRFDNPGTVILNQEDPAMEQALLKAQAALGIQADDLGGSGVIRQLILQKLLELMMKWAEEFFARSGN